MQISHKDLCALTISTLCWPRCSFPPQSGRGISGDHQSAITRRLQRLEQELNVTLLERQTRPLTLTAAGHRVYEQCLSIKRETKNSTAC